MKLFAPIQTTILTRFPPLSLPLSPGSFYEAIRAHITCDSHRISVAKLASLPQLLL